MNFKSKISIGAAVIISAFIIGQDDTSYDNFIEVEEYTEQNVAPSAIESHGNYTHQVAFQNPSVERENTHQNFQQDERSESRNYSQIAPPPTQESANPSSYNNGLKMQPTMDPKRGIPFGYHPIPQSWNVKSDGWYGPHNIIVKTLTSSPIMLQQKRFQSAKQLLQGELGDAIRKEGTITNVQDLPSVAQCDQNYSNAIALSSSDRWQNDAIGITMMSKGVKSFGIIKTTLCRNAAGGFWQYTIVSVEADPSHLDQTIKQTIYAQSNFKPNMQQVAMYKSEHNQKVNDSWSRHNNRMRQNQRNFEVSNNAIVSANNATNAAIMGTYESSKASFNRSNQQFTNGIYGENTVTNPYDGTSHQTSDMYDRTFMDAFGNQIQTNDQFYQPGMDPNAVGYQEVYPNGGY